MTSPNENEFLPPDSGKVIPPSWVWFFLLLLFAGMLLQFFLWFWQGKPNTSQPPFYQVTNREMSLFLWQNPNFMRKNNPTKRYLPGFETQDNVAMEEELADQLVIAPPELLFRYHTWNRLLKKEFTNTPIGVDEFLKFLTYAKEWLPENWPDAPPGYVKLMPDLPLHQVSDLSELNYTVLPLDVRIAFQGWQNFFLQSSEIERLQPTKQDVVQLLLSHPHYARNFWRNIEPDYLRSFATSNGALPENEVPLFLRQALFNASRK